MSPVLTILRSCFSIGLTLSSSRFTLFFAGQKLFEIDGDAAVLHEDYCLDIIVLLVRVVEHFNQDSDLITNLEAVIVQYRV